MSVIYSINIILSTVIVTRYRYAYPQIEYFWMFCLCYIRRAIMANLHDKTIWYQSGPLFLPYIWKISGGVLNTIRSNANRFLINKLFLTKRENSKRTYYCTPVYTWTLLGFLIVSGNGECVRDKNMTKVQRSQQGHQFFSARTRGL